MSSFILLLAQIVFRLIPHTKGFGIKRFVLRLAGAQIGKNVRICSSVRIIGNARLIIGDNTWIGHGTWLFCSAPISIGKDVNIAPICYIGTGTHVIDENGNSIAGAGLSLPISIGDGSWICAGSIILPGKTIGKKSVVAAGSVVTHDVMDYSLVAGVPSHIIKSFDVSNFQQ